LKRAHGTNSSKIPLTDLYRQLNNPNGKICSSALAGIRTILSSDGQMLKDTLHILIPHAVSPLSLRKIEKSVGDQLIQLFHIIFSTDQESISPHLGLVTAHIYAGLTSSNKLNYIFAFDVFTLLIDKYPKKCKQNKEVFDRYLASIQNPRRLEKIKLLNSMLIFISAYSQTAESFLPCEHMDVSFEDQISTRPSLLALEISIYFPLTEEACLHFDILKDGISLINLCKIFSQIIIHIITDEHDSNSQTFRKCDIIIRKLVELVVSACRYFDPHQLDELRNVFSTFNKTHYKSIIDSSLLFC